MVSRVQLDGQKQRRWWVLVRRIPAYVWIVGISGLILALILLGYHFKITLWDWAKLLFVPAVLAAGGLWFNRQQQERGLEIAERRSQDEALQAYLDGMSQLLTDKDRPLHRAQPGDILSLVSRARTLTVLSRLDGSRRGNVVRFLYEAGLITRTQTTLSLADADLRGAELPEEVLQRANLERINMNGGDLRGADLSEANLHGANLSEADLNPIVSVSASIVSITRANVSVRVRQDDGTAVPVAVVTSLSKATMTRANLKFAKLSQALIDGANMTHADLQNADLHNAQVSGSVLTNADLRRADMRNTNLEDADLRNAWLDDADLRNAILRRVDLRGSRLNRANLADVDLQGVKNLREAFLEGTNLPKADLAHDILSDAHLREANLTGADLRHAYFEGADLTHAYLDGVNLHGASLVRAVVKQEQLGTASTLEDATMPNGQKYEDWFKSKGGAENGKSGGSS